jgi:hypothetical protein
MSPRGRLPTLVIQALPGPKLSRGSVKMERVGPISDFPFSSSLFSNFLDL